MEKGDFGLLEMRHCKFSICEKWEPPIRKFICAAFSEMVAHDINCTAVIAN